jgi:hypothetical protein
MNDDELINHLRTHADHLDDVQSGTIGRTLNEARARAGAAPVRRRNRALIGAVVTLVIVTIAGGAVWRYVGRNSTIHVSTAVPVADTSSSQAPGTTSQVEATNVSASDTSTETTVAQPGPAVTSRIEVPDTIVAGRRADAALVINNNTGADITIPGCAPTWAIALTNASHPSNAAFTLPCLPPLVIGVGQTRFPTMLMASLSSCTDGPSLDDTMAKCVDGGPPPFPPGEYSAVLVGLEKDPLPGIPNPPPVNVQVVASGATSASSTSTPKPTSPPPTTIPPQTIPAVTTTMRPGSVATRIEIPDPILGGQEFTATLVVENNGDHELSILVNGCQPKWSIALTNESHPPDQAFTADCPTAPFVAPIGTTRFAITNRAIASSCTPNGVGTAATPKCINGGIPPLPPGEYLAVLIGSIPGIPNPAPVPIHVVAAP